MINFFKREPKTPDEELAQRVRDATKELVDAVREADKAGLYVTVVIGDRFTCEYSFKSDYYCRINRHQTKTY